VQVKQALLVFLIGIGIESPMFAAAPVFADYKVPVEKIETPRINLRSNPVGRKYRSQIRDTVKTQGVNFAGHYTIVRWGCGTDCTYLAIVDLHSGKIWHDPDLIATRGFVFRADSTLIIVDPWDGAGDFLPKVPTEYYVFRGGKLRRLLVLKHAAWILR
jgi:hypothetical protein